MQLRRALPTLAAAIVLAAGPVAGQSVITLDDFDLGGDTAEAPGRTGGASMEMCLRDPGNCPNDGGVDFTIDDVVNLGIVDREDVAETPASGDGEPVSNTTPLPSVDLEVLFDYNSSAIRPDQMGQLLDLAQILRGEDFARFTLIFMGHTDAQGSASYNEALSLERAQSVADFVTAAAGVPPGRTRAVGLGFQRLADPANPLSEKNRRVQLVLVPSS